LESYFLSLQRVLKKELEKVMNREGKVDEAKEKKPLVDSFIISSSSKWKKVFDFGIVIASLYSSYSATYL